MPFYPSNQPYHFCTCPHRCSTETLTEEEIEALPAFIRNHFLEDPTQKSFFSQACYGFKSLMLFVPATLCVFASDASSASTLRRRRFSTAQEQ